MLEYLFNKVAGLNAYNFIKKGLQHMRFPVKLAKFLKTPFSQNTFAGFFCTDSQAKYLLIKIKLITTSLFENSFIILFLVDTFLKIAVIKREIMSFRKVEK